jgi:hypothetical protein
MRGSKVKILHDSIEQTLETLSPAINQLPPTAFQRSKAAAQIMERAFNDVQRRYPKDVAAIAGMAWAIYNLAKRMHEAEGGNSDLIQLLN